MQARHAGTQMHLHVSLTARRRRCWPLAAAARVGKELEVLLGLQ